MKITASDVQKARIQARQEVSYGIRADLEEEFRDVDVALARILSEHLGKQAGTGQATSLNFLAAEINSINRGNGWLIASPDSWDDDHLIPTHLCLIHSEVSEALEGFRRGDSANVAEELADVLIRTLDLAGGLGVDIDREVRQKLEKNRRRGHRHGGKRV